MELRIKLMGALKGKAPEGDRLTVADGACIADVLAELEISTTQVQIVMVNGRPQPDRQQPLSPGDELTVLPPVGGG